MTKNKEDFKKDKVKEISCTICARFARRDYLPVVI